MPFFEGDIVKLKNSGDGGEVGRICRVDEGGYWVNFTDTGCLFVPLNSLEPASGNAPQCSDDCPPQ